MHRSFALVLVAAALACSRNTPLTKGVAEPGGAGAGAGVTGTSAGTAGASAGSAGASVGTAGASAGSAGASGAAGASAGSGAAGAGGAAPVCDPSVDRTIDDENCGTCGTRCGPTSTCNGGVCGPPVVEVLSPRGACGTMDLASAGGLLYWTDSLRHTVQSMRPGGDLVTTLSASEDSPAGVTAAGQSVVWASGARLRASVAGGPAKDVALAGPTIHGVTLTADGTVAYFSSAATISRVDVAGGTPLVVVTSVQPDNVTRPTVGAVAVQDDHSLAFATREDSAVFQALPGDQTGGTHCGFDFSGGGAADPLFCQPITVDEPGLFTELMLATPKGALWLAGGHVEAQWGSPSLSGFVYVASSANGDALTGAAATADTVYYSDGSVVYKGAIIPHDFPVRIARGQHGARAFAVDAARVYWSTADCAIESQGL
jgi:hypothetical protein